VQTVFFCQHCLQEYSTKTLLLAFIVPIFAIGTLHFGQFSSVAMIVTSVVALCRVIVYKYFDGGRRCGDIALPDGPRVCWRLAITAQAVLAARH